MNFSKLKKLFIVIFAICMVVACKKKEETEFLRISAKIPQQIKLSDTINDHRDTLKFELQCGQYQSIDSVALWQYANDTIRLALFVNFIQKNEKANINFLYRPNSRGIKKFELRAKAQLPDQFGLVRKTYPFLINVVD